MKRENTVSEKVSHLQIIEWVKFQEQRYGEDILTQSQHDRRSAELPLLQGFELTDDNSIYEHPRNLSSKPNQVVYSEVNMKLGDGLIVSATSAWSSFVVTATKKKDKQDSISPTGS